MEPNMKNDPPVDPADPRWLLSAMVDGEADAAELGRGLDAWNAADLQAKGHWHAYHLIGDVLRSGDLAASPTHDQDFLERLRRRLDDEPAVLAPRPLPVTTAPARRPAWVVPAALAAGVMGLATVLVVSMGPAGGPTSGATLAGAPAASVPMAVAVADQAATANILVAEPVPPGGRVVRDAQLDRYLRAHRDYSATMPGSLPGGAGRSIATVSLDR